MYKVIIIEDDPMVASINKSYLEFSPGFEIAAIFNNGSEALLYLEKQEADLAVVDYYMPVMDGREFITECRKKGLSTDFMMITAANNAREVEEIMRLGVVDYLVKPFSRERFDIALKKYLKKKALLKKDVEIAQSDIDSLFESAKKRETALEKGMQRQTLDMIKAFLRKNEGAFFTSNDIAKEIHLSRITVRRYMNYMLENEELMSRIDYTTGGRPSLKYTLKRK